MTESAGYPNVIAGRASGTNVPTDILMDPTSFSLYTGVWVWNSSSLAWEKMVQPKYTDNVELYGFNETNWQPARLDEITRALCYISTPHHEIHEGDAFVLSQSLSIPAANDYEIRIQTPDTVEWSHMEFEAVNDASLTVSFYETTTLTDVVGNRLTPINRNRNSSNTSSLTICHTPGGSGDGTLIWIKSIGSSFPLSGGGSTETRREFILKQNTAYLLRLAGSSGDALNYEINWYEHTNEAV